jgi:hypothetical protein
MLIASPPLRLLKLRHYYSVATFESVGRVADGVEKVPFG